MNMQLKSNRAQVLMKITQPKNAFWSVDGSVGSYGRVTRVIALSTLQKIAAIPLPNMTAPIYLKGMLAAIVKTVPCASPQNAPKGNSAVKQIQ